MFFRRRIVAISSIIRLSLFFTQENEEKNIDDRNDIAR